MNVPAQCKIIALLGYVGALVATPATVWWALAGQTLIVMFAGWMLKAKARPILRGLALESYFVGFVVLLPFLGGDPKIHIGFIAVSEPGLIAAWTIVAKASLGTSAALLVATTTPTSELLHGLRALRTRGILVNIAGFALRYHTTLREQWRTMMLARAARGYLRPHLPQPAQLLTIGRSFGTLFVRAFERGERVHLAALSRGYDPQRYYQPPTMTTQPRDWKYTLWLPGVAAVIAVTAQLTRL